MTEPQSGLPHRLTLTERKQLTVSGVTEIISFDETAVIARTELGTLVVQGKGLQLKTLLPEGGQVSVDGNISALIYEEPRPTGSLWRRLIG